MGNPILLMEVIRKQILTLVQYNRGNIRYFCSECGSHLYAYDKTWGENVYPFASAIDTPLPEVVESDVYHILLNSKANWVNVTSGRHNFEEYPDCSLEDWHKSNKKFIE